jgi:hypothetical protein
LGDYSFNTEAFFNLMVPTGLWPADHSFNPEAFPNLKESIGFCPDGAASQ